MFATLSVAMACCVAVGVLFKPADASATGIYRPINYQGKLTNSGGVAISNGTYDLRFSLYDAASAGVPLWTEVWNSGTQKVTATGGLFSIALGTHTAMTGSVNFNTDSLFLQVEFDPGADGDFEEVFTPRRRFASVPYAHNADSLDGLDSTEFIRSDVSYTASGTLTIFPRDASKIGIDILSTAGNASTAALKLSTQGANHIVFGSGATDYDVNLYRGAANLLKTDGSFHAMGTISGSSLVVSGSASILGSLVVNRAISGATLEVLGTASGENLFATNSVTGSHLYAAASFGGAGLADCDDAGTSKLLWDDATKQFACGTDQSGGSAGTETFSGAVLTLGDARYVRKQGDTMTGTLVIDMASGDVNTIGLRVLNAISGAVIRAQNTLASSGTLIVKKYAESNTGNILIVDTEGLVYDATSKRVGIGTAEPETTLEVVGTVSGRTLHAHSILTSSGTLAAEGATVLRGDVTLGDATADVIAVLGRFSTSLVPSTDNAYDLGTDSLRWRDLYLSGGTLHLGSQALEGKMSYASTDSEGLQFFGNGGALLPALFVSSGSRIGIGTMTPGSTLSISGAVIIGNGELGSDPADAGLALEIVGTASGRTLHAHDVLSSSGMLVVNGHGIFRTETGPKRTLEILGTMSGTALKAGLLSTDAMLLAQLEGGAYFGRVGIREEQWVLGNYASNWTAKDSSRNWYGISMSSDGRMQTAVVNGGNLYVSSDYGETWTAKDSSRNWYGISMSSDGKIQTATVYNGNIYVSTDYGNTWVAKDSVRLWYRVAMSSDGKIQTAGTNAAGLFVSYDYGNTWTEQTGINAVWHGVGMSSDGKIQTAVVYGGSLYVSTDYGNTWVSKDLSGVLLYGISMSSDGRFQTAVSTNSSIYVSTNYGDTWTTKESGTWYGIAMSSDGKIQTAAGEAGIIYLSTDYGDTWTSKNSSGNWYDIAMNSDGKIQTAVAYGGNIKISHADASRLGNLGIGQAATGARLVIGQSDASNAAALLIDTEESTAAQDVFRIVSDVAADEDNAFRIQADGTVYSDNAYNSSGADYAEWFFSSTGPLPPGEVVCIDTARPNTVRRCDRDADSNVMGIVSTKPAFVGNVLRGADGLPVPGYVLVGLIGQVPAKVVAEGAEAIRPGDSLTPASRPGFARRARAGEATVGVALEGLSSGEGTVNVLISRRNQSLTAQAVEDRVLRSIEALEIDDEVRMRVQDAVNGMDIPGDVARTVREEWENDAFERRVRGIVAAHLSGSLLRPAATTVVDTMAVRQSLTVSASIHAAGDLSAGGRLAVAGALTASDLTLSGGLVLGGDALVAGTLTAGRLRAASGASVDGTLHVAGDLEVLGRLRFTGGLLETNELLVHGATVLVGNVTVTGLARFDGDVTIRGSLTLSNRQAGHARIGTGHTSVTVRFGSGFGAVPVVSATPASFVETPWRVATTTATGFVLQLQQATAGETSFTWVAIGVIDPMTHVSEPPAGLAAARFPVDAAGVPVSSNDAWNACIRNLTLLSDAGLPYSCARYHDGNVWEHPDLHVLFTYDGALDPPLLLLPDGYGVSAGTTVWQWPTDASAPAQTAGDTEGTHDTPALRAETAPPEVDPLPANTEAAADPDTGSEDSLVQPPDEAGQQASGEQAEAASLSEDGPRTNAAGPESGQAAATDQPPADVPGAPE